MRWVWTGLSILIILPPLLLLPPAPVRADAPQSSVLALALPLKGVVLTPGQKARLDVRLENHGSLPLSVRLQVAERPEGWTARVESSLPQVGVFALTLPPQGSQRLQLLLEVPAKAAPGTYRVVLQARAGEQEVTEEVQVQVEQGGYTPPGEGVRVAARFPVLRGPSGSTFVFSLDLSNRTGEDQTVDLLAQTPVGWQYRFKPPFEEKQISSISLKAGESRGVSLEVRPPPRARPGEYPIRALVRWGDREEPTDLKVVVTGTYDLRVETGTGLLNTRATAGREAIVTLLLLNAGTAPLDDITFISSKPEGWQVKFDPDRIDRLEPREVREVTVLIRPAPRAVRGDYAVTLTVNNPQVSEDLELRVTVVAPTLWGWVGMGIVMVVVLGLLGLFLRLGRR